jgi:hypothetical protein
MSSLLECYALDPDQLWRAFGSNDEDLASSVLASCAEHVAEFDESTPDKAPSFAEMLNTYLAGEKPHMAWVGWNKELLRTLCNHFGEWLDGDAWSRIDAEFVEHIGAGFESAGAPFDLWDLISSGPPDNIPLTNPYTPGGDSDCGFASAAQVKEIAAWASSINLDDTEDEFESAAVGEFKMWFAEAARRGHGLAFFYN